MTLVVGEGSGGMGRRSTRESLHKLHVLGQVKLRVAKFKGGNVPIFQKIHVLHFFYLSGASSHLLFQVPNRELVLMLDSLYIRQVMHY